MFLCTCIIINVHTLVFCVCHILCYTICICAFHVRRKNIGLMNVTMNEPNLLLRLKEIKFLTRKNRIYLIKSQNLVPSTRMHLVRLLPRHVNLTNLFFFHVISIFF